MKNTLYIIGLFLFVVSCKKDYVCECTVSPGNTKWEYTIKETNKGRAKANCISTSYEDVVGSSTITVTSDCKLK
jgi:hypothetical protein